MSYTLWSLGRLLGQTDFAFLRAEDRQRRGWLIPTKDGEPLVEIAAGVTGAMEAAIRAFDLEEAAADIAAAVDRRDALELELRGPDGESIPVERLTIRDTVVLMSMADARVEADKSWYDSLTEEEREEFDASVDLEIASDDSAIEHAAVDDEEPGMVDGLPRYEISVRLVDDRAIPSRE